jgi:hypothetical protein
MVLLKSLAIGLALATWGLAILACNDRVEYADISLELSADRILDGDTITLPDVEALWAGDILRLQLNISNVTHSELTLTRYIMWITNVESGAPLFREEYELDPPFLVLRGETRAVLWSYEIPGASPGRYNVSVGVSDGVSDLNQLTNNFFRVVTPGAP